MTFDKWAESYHAAGFSVLPLNGKKPIFDEWSKYSDEKPTDKEIEQWSKDYADKNIGLVTGKSSGTCGVDFDYEGSDKEKVQNIVFEIIPPSPVRKRGKKGWTAMYRYNGLPSTWINRNNHRLIDFLSDGKQTVLPPSIHPDSGEPYVWITEDTLLDINPKDLPEITQSMLDKLKELAEFDFSSKENPFNKTGGRHDVIIAYAWANVEGCVSMDDLVERLIAYDLKKFPDDPYFKDKKYFRNKDQTAAATEIANKIIKHVTKSKAKKGIAWHIGKAKERSNNTAMSDVLKNCRGHYDLIETKAGPRSVPDYSSLANALRDNNVLKASDAVVRFYEYGFWNTCQDIQMNSFISELTEEQVQPGHIENFKKLAYAKNFFDFAKYDGSRESGKVNLENGVLDLKSGTIEPHSSEYLFKQKLPIAYSAEAQCPEWIKFLKFVFKDNQELVDLSQKIFGYIIMGGEPFLHRAFVLYGSGRNGKSTYIEILRDLLGDSASAMSLSNINKEFSAVALDGKLANIVEETPNTEIDSEKFKSAVGGGTLQVAHKGKDEFPLKVTARFVFACNDMPIFKDKNNSILDRLVFLPFDVYIKEEDRDVFILKKLRDELPGILNWAVEGVKKVLETGSIKEPAACLSLKGQFKEETDSFYSWYLRTIQIERENPAKVSLNAVYSKYKADVVEAGQHPFSRDKFAKRLRTKLEEDGVRLETEVRVPEFDSPSTMKRVRGFACFVYKTEE